MIERDYLMRQLMQLLGVLQKIIRYRKKGELKLANEEIHYFYTCLNIGEDPGSLTVSQLVRTLLEEKKLTNEQLEMVAYVLKEQGEIAGDENSSLDFFRKAHFLLDKVERESITFSMERLLKLGELKEYLNQEEEK